MLAEMLIDIYASKKRNAVTILHDKRFDPPLTGLEFDPQARRLEFVFANMRRDLGVPLREALVPHFRKSKRVTFFLVDPQTRSALEGMEVPIKIVESSATTGKVPKKTGLRGMFRRSETEGET
jgi:hypothetical protein